MSTITQRITSAFVVLCGRYGDVAEIAHDREQSRQSLYREASRVPPMLSTGRALPVPRRRELQQQLARRQTLIQEVSSSASSTPSRSTRNPTRAGSRSVPETGGWAWASRSQLLQVVAGSLVPQSVPTWDQAAEEAGQRAGQLPRSDRQRSPNPKVEQRSRPDKFI